MWLDLGGKKIPQGTLYIIENYCHSVFTLTENYKKENLGSRVNFIFHIGHKRQMSISILEKGYFLFLFFWEGNGLHFKNWIKRCK